MNKTQTNHYRMFLGVQGYLNDKSGPWSSIPRIVGYKNDFDEIILHLVEKSGESGKGISVTGKKERLKNQIAEKLSVISGMITAFAYENDDMDLANKVKISKTEVNRMKETNVEAYAKPIISIASQHLQELVEYGLSEALITELNGVINEFNGLIGKPQSLLNKKYLSLGEVGQLVDKGNQLLKNKLDNLMLMFRENNPIFYDGYKRARTIVDR